jgi:DNA polymerase-4
LQNYRAVGSGYDAPLGAVADSDRTAPKLGIVALLDRRIERVHVKNLRGLPTASATAKEILVRIFEETRLTAPAGVSYNKFLAKLASGQRKPNRQYVITPEMGPAFIAALPVAKFHGVGPVTASKMQRLGIETGADLRAKPLSFLQQHFGKSAAWYLGSRMARTTVRLSPTVRESRLAPRQPSSSI